LQKFALFSSALFKMEVHSELPPSSGGVHPARISMSLSIFVLFVLRYLLLGI
jgi:hypothetical protein